MFAFLPKDCVLAQMEPAGVQDRLLAEAESLEEEFAEVREEGGVALPAAHAAAALRPRSSSA